MTEAVKQTCINLLSLLNEPERSQAIENLDINRLSFNPTTVRQALIDGIWWVHTPEGHDYWYRIYAKLCDNKYVFKSSEAYQECLIFKIL